MSSKKLLFHFTTHTPLICKKSNYFLDTLYISCVQFHLQLRESWVIEASNSPIPILLDLSRKEILWQYNVWQLEVRQHNYWDQEKLFYFKPVIIQYHFLSFLNNRIRISTFHCRWTSPQCSLVQGQSHHRQDLHCQWEGSSPEHPHHSETGPWRHGSQIQVILTSDWLTLYKTDL